MYKTKWMTSAIVSVFLSATGVRPGFAQQPIGAGAVDRLPPTSGTSPLTPELKARQDETYHLDQAAAVALDAGHYAEAETDARQSVSIYYGSGLSQELLAAALGAQGKTQEALEAYRRIAGAGGDHPRNLLPYALLLLNSGQWMRAVAAYNKALSNLADGGLVRANSNFSPAVLHPKELATAIHIALGLTYNGADSWGGNSQADKALNEYTKALQLAPDSALANYYYGFGLQQLGRNAQASAAFQKTVKMAKGEVKAAAERALRKQKKPA